MQINNKKAQIYIDSLLQHPLVRQLELVEDQGVKVSTHTYDVLKISEDEMKREFIGLDEYSKTIDVFAIIVGIIIHDISKGSIRINGEKLSHSQMMIKRPDYIIKEAEKIMEDIEEATNLKLQDEIKKNIAHIVISHHGKWGKIKPSTKEANIVHKADVYSAKYHRINPIGADEILRYMAEGLQTDEICKKLDCTSGILKDRLKRAKIELGLKSTKQLVNYYSKNKRIPIGDDFFTKRIRETSRLINSVEKIGFRNLIKNSILIKYLDDGKIFE
jgi:23S rRNA maturation-related 3'-5' exoribonuclease YhaM